MRNVIRSTALVLLAAAVLSEPCAGQAPSGSAPSPPRIMEWVKLNSPADLQRLRETNFNHYLRARKILAAASEICQPGSAHAYTARFRSERPDCRSMLWMASNPPKKLLRFHLDDVGYIALVSVKVSGRLLDGPERGSPAKPEFLKY